MKRLLINLSIGIFSLTTLSWAEITELKALRPSDILPDGIDSRKTEDGTKIRKGTIKTTIENIKILNEILAAPAMPERKQIIEKNLEPVVELIKPIEQGGLFEFFEPLEWLQDDQNQGRILVTALYLKSFPNQVTPIVKGRLEDLLKVCSPEVCAHVKIALGAQPESSIKPETTAEVKTIRPKDIFPDGKDSMTAPDGTVMRKGTIKATMENIKILNKLLDGPSSEERAKQVEQNLQVVSEFIKPLHNLEVFKFFKPIEWLKNDKNQGRILVAVLYLKNFPEAIAPEVKTRLEDLLKVSTPEVCQKIQDCLKM